MTLEGKTAIVTGASHGIGRAVAERLGADGANVVVDYNTGEAAAQEVVDTIVAAGGKAVAVRADVSVPADVLRLFDEAQAAFGGVDILVNNAGIVVVAPTAHLAGEDFDRMVAVNLKGPFLAMQQAALRLNDHGRIVNISTGYVKLPSPYVGVYVATKAAVDQIGASLAKELGERKITVNSVAPGLTDTEGVVPEVRAQADVYIGMTPLGRIGEPRDIADVVSFLAGEDARWVTGQVISATGGLA